MCAIFGYVFAIFRYECAICGYLCAIFRYVCVHDILLILGGEMKYDVLCAINLVICWDKMMLCVCNNFVICMH